MRSFIFLLGLFLLLSLHTGSETKANNDEKIRQPEKTKTLYDRFCLACHGEKGDGHGPATPWLWPKPRDFQTGLYKWRSTSFNQPATLNDLALTIREGVPGTSMHAFGISLDESQRQDLAKFIQSFAPSKPPSEETSFQVPAPPQFGKALVEKGKQLFINTGCVTCHGKEGAGDGPLAASLRDVDGNLGPPFNLREKPLKRPGLLESNGSKNSSSHIRKGIYLTIATGLSGTAMPGYEALPKNDLWALTAFIDSIRFREHGKLHN